MISFIAQLAECKRAPFDLPEAESELVSGFHTEYSGMRFAIFFLAEYAQMYLVSAVAVVLFLGGWYTGIAPLDRAVADSPVARNLLGAVVIISKSFFLVFIQMWLRWTLPRIRLDQMMYLCLKVLLPFSMVVLVLSTFWEAVLPYQAGHGRRRLRADAARRRRVVRAPGPAGDAELPERRPADMSLGTYFAQIGSAAKSLVAGMAVTIRYMVRPKEIVTIQYGSKKNAPKERYIPDRHRGIHFLETEKCIFCHICEKACPVDCIVMDGTRDGGFDGAWQGDGVVLSPLHARPEQVHLLQPVLRAVPQGVHPHGARVRHGRLRPRERDQEPADRPAVDRGGSRPRGRTR